MSKENNDPTEEFKAWMEERRLKAADVCGDFQVSEQAIHNWRSAGVPSRRWPHVEAFMAAWVDPASPTPAKSLQDYFPPGTVIQLTPGEAQFDRWTKAFKQSDSSTFREWAETGLDRIAAEEIADQAIPQKNGTAG